MQTQGGAHQYFSIGKTATVISDQLGKVRELFATQRALLCCSGIDPSLLAALQGFAAKAKFKPQVVEVGHRTVEEGALTSTAVQLALNRLEFRQWLEALTDCRPLNHIEGKVVKTMPGGVDHLDWHKDTMKGIKLGMTLHIGDEPYDGGAFELRTVAGKTELFRHEKAEPGDVVIFDIKPDVEHRVTSVSRGGARLVFTGWFMEA